MKLFRKSKWLKNQIKRYNYLKPRNKREAINIQEMVIAILLAVVIGIFIVREAMF